MAARWRPLYRTAYLLIGDHALAEDLVRTALTKSYVVGPDPGRRGSPQLCPQDLVRTAMMWWRRKSWRAERHTRGCPTSSRAPSTRPMASSTSATGSGGRSSASRPASLVALTSQADPGSFEATVADAVTGQTLGAATFDGEGWAGFDTPQTWIHDTTVYFHLQQGWAAWDTSAANPELVPVPGTEQDVYESTAGVYADWVPRARCGAVTRRRGSHLDRRDGAQCTRSSVQAADTCGCSTRTPARPGSSG